MSEKKKKQDKEKQEVVIEAPEVQEELEEIQENEAADELSTMRAELDKAKNDYLFLAAEFDNYRKRVAREKSDLIKNGGERVLSGILPVVDDFERGLAAAAKAADDNRDDNADAIFQGMEMIYNKLIKFLESQGVKAMESTGATFDSDLHEAVTAFPAPSEDLKGKVMDTTQKGYMLNDKVLRYAKVVVCQ